MKLRLALFVAVAALYVPAGAIADGVSPAPTVTWSIRNDTSPPLRDLATAPVLEPGPAREIPLRIVEGLPEKPPSPGVPDPRRQTETRPIEGGPATPPPIINIEGVGNVNGVLPPDTEGDVGPDFYVQWINLSFAVFDKTDPGGTPVFGPVNGNTIWAGFGGVCQNTNNGDPIVLYDHLADRWLLSQFAVNSGVQCIAISTTSDPTGPYHRYEFTVTPGGQNDYPKIGLWPDGYYLSTRDFPVADGLAGAGVFERDEMLVGNPARFVKFELECLANDCVDGFQPSHLEGPPPPAGTPNTFVKDWDDDFNATGALPDRYRLWDFSVDWTVDPPGATFVEIAGVPTSADFDQDMCGFFVRNCIPQPGTAQGLDPIDELTMYRAQFRQFPTHQTLLVNHTVDATGGDVAGVRWAELRNTGAGWTLHQDGTYAPAGGDNRWMGSIAMDQQGNIALGYSVSSGATFPSVRYTSRRAGDPLGMMPGGEVELIAGTGHQTSGSHRWGDYSTMSVDPEDGCTFWFTQEYVETSGNANWKTRIGSFVMPECLGQIFADGFESGDTTSWSGSVP